jgi:hypothetical protein
MFYYPVGTVVLLKEATHPIMIYGRLQRRNNDKNVWDYVGCLYPEGYIGDDANIFFNADDIGSVVHRGLITPAEKKMQTLFNKIKNE